MGASRRLALPPTYPPQTTMFPRARACRTSGTPPNRERDPLHTDPGTRPVRPHVLLEANEGLSRRGPSEQASVAAAADPRRSASTAGSGVPHERHAPEPRARPHSTRIQAPAPSDRMCSSRPTRASPGAVLPNKLRSRRQRTRAERFHRGSGVPTALGRAARAARPRTASETHSRRRDHTEPARHRADPRSEKASGSTWTVKGSRRHVGRAMRRLEPSGQGGPSAPAWGPLGGGGAHPPLAACQMPTKS